MRLFRTRKSRRPALASPTISHSPSHRISTLSNATTLHPLLSPEPLPPGLLSSFPVPPSSFTLPMQSNTAFALSPPPQQPQPQGLQTQNSSASTYTSLPNISQSSLDTLADPLGRLPNAPNRLSTYEAFINSAREQEVRRVEREQRMVRAWIQAEEDRRVLAMREAQQNSRSWPHDPWRGGFGPSSNSRNEVGLGIRVGGGMTPRRVEREVQKLKTSGSGVQGVKVWLRKVTSLERLRV